MKPIFFVFLPHKAISYGILTCTIFRPCLDFGYGRHLNPVKFTIHMERIKPMVPNTRIGGKAFTVSSPACVKALYDTELPKAMVGMKKATLMA